MPDGWGRVDEVLQSVLSRPPGERDAFLRRACAGDTALENEVRSLLAADEQAGSFLQDPAIHAAARALAGDQSAGGEHRTDPLETARMALSPGSRLGPYEIASQIGAGGMGEVYRAIDTNLARQVAIKVLPEAVAADPDRLARFDREAKTLAALNHPNIAAIYGLERSGTIALVMELVEGLTLADRIAQGAIPVSEALPIARQIAEALEAAHEQAIIHRDLKPANIKLRPDGTVKVLDFGLATHTAALGHDDEIRSLNHSVTHMSRVAGTPAYMAPEQVQGKLSDGTDLFAFGLVLYEMVTGRLPFPGTSLGSMLASGTDAVIQPPCQTRSRIAVRLNALILGLLERDPARRPKSAAAVRRELLALEKTAPRRPARMAAVAASVIVLAAVAALAGKWARGGIGPQRGPIDPVQLTSLTDSAVEPALSPDGRTMAFLVGSGTGFPFSGQVYTVSLPDGQPIQRTHDAFPKYGVAFSPDGSQVTYTAVGGGLGWRTMAVPLVGGEPQLLVPNAAGLSWLDQHHALFSEILTGLHMGLVTATDRRESLRSVYLPKHERAMAHYGYASPDRQSVLIVEMGPTGGFGRCRLTPFDGRTEGSEVGPDGPCTSAAWSPDGRWMYFVASVNGASHVWREPFPSGALEQITSGPATARGLAMSPDGRSLVTSLGIQESGAWMHTPQGERLVSPDGYASRLRFSRDGRFLFYVLRRTASDVAGRLWQTELSSGKTEPLTQSVPIGSYDVSPDGSQIVLAVKPKQGAAEIWLTSRGGADPPRRLTAAGEDTPRFGPDGEIVFRQSEGQHNYLFVMNADGSKRRKIAPIPITETRSMSPDRRWAFVMAPVDGVTTTAVLAVPLDGGPVRRTCPATCAVGWSPDGAIMYIRPFLEERTIAVPVPKGESMPLLPVAGVRSVADAATLPGSRLVDFALGDPSTRLTDVAPAQETGTFAYARISHRDLFRIQLP
jgi:Tol biopolymer transport system component